MTGPTSPRPGQPTNQTWTRACDSVHQAATRIACPLTREQAAVLAYAVITATSDPATSMVASVVAAADTTSDPPSATVPIEARPDDVARLRAAIAEGVLPARPSVEAIRTYLRISPAYARAARVAVVEGGSR